METLSYLIPCSITISSLQVYSQWSQVKLYRFSVFYYLLPMVAIGLSLIFYIPEINLFLIIGVMLLLTSFVRLVPSLDETISNILADNFRSGLSIIGLIHGLTNLGGALLAILASNITNSKNERRYVIAYYYFIFTFIQLIKKIPDT